MAIITPLHFPPYPSFTPSKCSDCLFYLPLNGGHDDPICTIYAKDFIRHQLFQSRSIVAHRISVYISEAQVRLRKPGLIYSANGLVLLSTSHKLTRSKIRQPFDRRSFFSSLISGLAVSLLNGLPALAVTERNRKSQFNEQQLLELNKRMQKLNNAPPDFPTFIREGFDVKVVTNDKYVRCDSGLIYLDIQEGQGDYPKDGQQVIFHYIGYNESGRRVDSSYQQGQPSKTRIGIKGLIPGFEEGIRTMKSGGKRRIVVPPELGPPVGPSTFFSAKQFEVFDVELLGIQNCNRRTVGFYSDVVCD